MLQFKFNNHLQNYMFEPIIVPIESKVVYDKQLVEGVLNLHIIHHKSGALIYYMI